MKLLYPVVATLALGGVAHAQSLERPNILFICIDDLRTELGAYGSTDVITPNLDKLASEGRLFTHQYVQAPTSGASRAMMLTGRGARTKGDVNNFAYSNRLIDSEETDHPESFVHHLRRAGYHTVGMGKVSHSDNGYIYPEGRKLMDLPYSWDEYINNPNSPWPDRSDARLHGYDNGLTRIKGETPAFEFKNLPDSCYADYELAQLAVDQLDKLSQRGADDEPFFMAVGFYKPHLPFTAPAKYWDMYEGREISLSPNPTFPEGVDKAFVHKSAECFSNYHHPEKGGAGVVLSEEYSRAMRRAYFSALTFTDTQVGKVLDKLEESGLSQNTIVILWGDHGWHLGDHTIWGKHSVFERALNSTFMVRTPDMKHAGERSDELVAAVDIYPTICELTGCDTPEGLDGTSFVKQIYSPRKHGRKYVVSYWGNLISVRDSRYRFSIFDDGKKRAIMLFDHQTDPIESVNVADQNPKVVERLMKIAIKENRGFLPRL